MKLSKLPSTSLMEHGTALFCCISSRFGMFSNLSPSILTDSIDIATSSATVTPELHTNKFVLSVFTLKGLINSFSNVLITSLTKVSNFRTLYGRTGF